MQVKCRNCGTVLKDKYCPHCGQSVEFKEITWAYCIDELILNNLKQHKGLLFTIKRLISNPKRVIFDYLEGKRVVYTGAMQFLLFVIVFRSLIGLLLGKTESEPSKNMIINIARTKLNLIEYRKALIILFTLFSSLGSSLVYRIRKLSIAKHFYVNSYIIGISLLLLSLVNIVTLYKYQSISIYCFPLFVVSFYIRIFKGDNLRIMDILKGLWCFIISMAIVLAVLLLITLGFTYFLKLY
ncbi:MAG: DUF3667 domain-containing protein [Candidatus Cloacimonetes bacterium]|nr:DUF3667 domain-containing protein [Candidatus Cloacimonadota bacterium]